MNDHLNWLRARLQTGLTVNARLLRVEKEKFMIELRLRVERSQPAEWKPPPWRGSARKRNSRKRGDRTPEELDEIDRECTSRTRTSVRRHHNQTIYAAVERAVPEKKAATLPSAQHHAHTVPQFQRERPSTTWRSKQSATSSYALPHLARALDADMEGGEQEMSDPC